MYYNHDAMLCLAKNHNSLKTINKHSLPFFFLSLPTSHTNYYLTVISILLNKLNKQNKNKNKNYCICYTKLHSYTVCIKICLMRMSKKTVGFFCGNEIMWGFLFRNEIMWGFFSWEQNCPSTGFFF